MYRNFLHINIDRLEFCGVRRFRNVVTFVFCSSVDVVLSTLPVLKKKNAFGARNN